MARSSWGTIRKLPSKKYQASYLGPDQKRHTAPTTFTTKTQARLWLDEQRLAIEKGIWQQKQAVTAAPETFKTYAESHIRLQTNANGQNLRKNTKDTYTRLLALHLTEFHDQPLDKISKRQVDEWWHKKVQSGIATTASKAYKLLHSVLKRAVADGLIASNPCKIRGAHGLTSGKRKEIPTPHEVGQLINNIDSKYKLVLILMSYGGLRFSEATALTVKDLKVVGKAPNKHFEIQINKAVTESNGVFTVAEPKSKASKRTVALPLQFTPLVAKLLLERKLNRDTQLLVEAPKGGYLRNSVFRKALDSASKKSGITRIRITSHCCRHFAATTYLEAGASIADLQTWLGDSTQSAALGYVHATKDRAQLANSMKIDI
jgi:integrase